jgi:Mn2+/Fe2+ NRAMP family transporter
MNINLYKNLLNGSVGVMVIGLLIIGYTFYKNAYRIDRLSSQNMRKLRWVTIIVGSIISLITIAVGVASIVAVAHAKKAVGPMNDEEAAHLLLDYYGLLIGSICAVLFGAGLLISSIVGGVIAGNRKIMSKLNFA